MRVDIATLEDGPRRFAGTMAVPPASHQGGDGGLGGPMAFAATIELKGDAVHVTGWLHATLQVPCSRCLETTPLAVDHELHLVFRAAENAPAPSDTELDAQRLDVDYYAGGALDLRSVLAEQVLLDLPMKPLCSSDCQGLCPQCGVNRGKQACDCRPAVDARLSPLAALRDRQ